MKISLAEHYGMCFGVRDALKKTYHLAAEHQVTILGQLVHNPAVDERLESLGVERGDLHDLSSVPAAKKKPQESSPVMLITAHGAADRDRQAWQERGHRLEDTSCPLVRKAHNALAQLVLSGHFPVVIGKRDHVEVRGLTGDFPEAVVVFDADDVKALPFKEKIGVISQTTQPIDRVEAVVEAIKCRHPAAEVTFVDTVCQPTKDRQQAIGELSRRNEVVIVVGGRNSNNTTQLAHTARAHGAIAYQVAGPGEIDPAWFRGVTTVGITAGTSTLKETVEQVHERIQQIDRAAPDGQAGSRTTPRLGRSAVSKAVS